MENEHLRALVSRVWDLLQCPIRHSAWRDPVVASDGYTYDRRHIKRWQARVVREGEPATSPMTREVLQRQLYPNRLAAQVLQCLLAAGFRDLAQSMESQHSADSEEEVTFDPHPGALPEAIAMGSETVALRLLELPELPGLNTVDGEGLTVLHQAIAFQLPDVALAIIARPDFLGVNAKDDYGWTALHMAAHHCHLVVCQALASRADFSELRAVDSDFGRTASQWARMNRHFAVAEFLELTEAQTIEQPAR